MKTLPALILSLGFVIGALILNLGHPVAQTSSLPPSMAIVVANCGTPPLTYSAGALQPLTQTTGGALCVNQ